MLTRLPTKKSYTFNKKLTLFGACCLFLSAVEYMIPKPWPFMRLGLSNLPIILALDIFSFRSILILAAIKTIGQSLITGTLFSYVFLFSFAGTFSSAVLMFFLRRILLHDRVTFIGVGTAGSMVSCSFQLALAWFFIFRENFLYIAPPFLTIGLFTGIAMGVFCEIFSRYSKWYRLQGELNREKIAEKKEQWTEKSQLRKAGRLGVYESIFSAKALFITGLIIMPSVLFNPSTKFRFVQFLFFWFLVWFSGKKTRPLLKIMITFLIIAFNLIIPYGRVLFYIGSFKITSGALTAGIHRAVTFQALIMLSNICVRDDLKIPGVFGGLLSESMYMFSVMMNKIYQITWKFSWKNIVMEIDKLIMEIKNVDIPKIDDSQKTTKIGYIILALSILLSWIPWLFIFV